MVNALVIALFVGLSVVMAMPPKYEQPQMQMQPKYPKPQEINEERDYKFSYMVKDDPTYNQQSRDENKYGNTITGQYTVLEPTGELRVVNYIADDYGFRADVKNQPQSGGYSAPAQQMMPQQSYGGSYGQ